MRILYEAETPTIETVARTRTSMIAVNSVKGLVASVLLEGSTHAEWSHACLEPHLFKEVSPRRPSSMYNATLNSQDPRVNRPALPRLFFLLSYSPGFNPIKQYFAAIKNGHNSRLLIPTQWHYSIIEDLWGRTIKNMVLQ